MICCRCHRDFVPDPKIMGQETCVSCMVSPSAFKEHLNMPFKQRPCTKCHEYFEPTAPNQQTCESCKKGGPVREPTEIVSDVVDAAVESVDEIDETLSTEEAFLSDAYRLCRAARDVELREFSLTLDGVTISLHKCTKL